MTRQAPLYRLESLMIRYGETTALDLPALDVAPGEVTALVGPNGSGKSTLLKVLAFLLAPGAGRLYYRGRAVAAGERTALRRRVGLVQQNPYLLRRSVRANVELGLRLRGVGKAERRARAGTLLERMGLAALAERPAAALSGGEAQKVAIARILVLEPEVLLLDEPFTHLDRRFVAEMETLIRTARAQHAGSIVFSTHDQVRARTLADRVLTLVQGRIAPIVPANLFHGRLEPGRARFDTGRLCIAVPEEAREGDHAAVDPEHVVISRAALDSSMRNAFEGRVVGLTDRAGRVEVRVDAGEEFVVVVSHAAHAEQRLGLGERVWVSFKASAVRVF